MSIERTIERGRAAAERQMLDTFAAYAPSGRAVDPGTGMEGPGYTPRGTTHGKLQSQSRQGDTNTRTATVGSLERPVVEGGLHIPLSAPVPVAGAEGVGWEYECTDVAPASDPALVGRRWRVVDAPAKSFATARRLDVVEIPQEA